MGEKITRLEIDENEYSDMLMHIQTHFPEEACGLLGGCFEEGAAVAQIVIPIENELHSPVRFRMAPAEQLKAFYTLEQQKYELVALFHSHPTGPDHLSATDLSEFAYPGVLSLICFPRNLSILPENVSSWGVRAFQIEGVFSAQAPIEEVPLTRTTALRRGSPETQPD